MKPPCIDCITFPICKSKFNSMVANEFNQSIVTSKNITYALAVLHLERKCSILESYLENQQVSVDEHRLESIHDLYAKVY